MGHSYVGVGGMGDFTVTKSNPSGTIVRFTLSDAANKVTTLKMLRAILGDAINQWLALERADLDANGDSAVLGSDTRFVGEGFAAFDWNFAGKYAEVELTATSSISTTGDITVSIPYADVI